MHYATFTRTHEKMKVSVHLMALFLYLQVQNRSLSFFVNGLRASFMPVSTVTPADFITDSSGTFRVGQSFDGWFPFCHL